jgi:glycine C-acetyltransferase
MADSRFGDLSSKQKRELLAKLLEQEGGQPGGARGATSPATLPMPPGKSLLHPDAATTFELLDRASEMDVYPYQVPLEGRAGARVQVDGRTLLMLSSYDYLGLIGHPDIDAGAIEAVKKYGTGTGGVRLLTGTNHLHLEMERQLAEFKGTPAAISFSSGYLANLAVISALLTDRDRVILDALAHRSLADACELARVPMRRFRHNDMASLRRELDTPPFGRRTLIVTDGVFSMEGDICPLPELLALKKMYGAFLMIDESHSLGVLGATGRGIDEHFGLATHDVDIWTASLGKAIPSNGGFAAVSREVAAYLQHAAAPFIFSAALCPAAVAATCIALTILRADPRRVATLNRNAAVLRNGLRELGYDVGNSATPIIPVMLKSELAAVTIARSLRDLGVLVTPVMFPAVPFGGARLRLCATAGHTTADLDFGLAAFRELRRSFLSG